MKACSAFTVKVTLLAHAYLYIQLHPFLGYRSGYAKKGVVCVLGIQDYAIGLGKESDLN
jgi:hypothetical protein